MGETIIKQHDNLGSNDSLQFSMDKGPFRTQILGGYDPYIDDQGVNQLGEVMFDTENTIVLGGALFSLEKVFGVKSPLTVEYLNTIMGIANSGTPITEIYPKETVVCLFGVGTGGSGDTITSVKDVKFQEREIVDIIPFRYTDEHLSSLDADRYWFKKKMTNGKTAYYLKSFDSTPQIKVLWRDAEGDNDGTEVESSVYNSTRTESIEAFVEIVLKVSKRDCREWFEFNGNIDQTRINTIALFTGKKGYLDDGTVDYKQVKMFSKLNIANEMLTTSKDLTIIYRIYSA